MKAPDSRIVITLIVVLLAWWGTSCFLPRPQPEVWPPEGFPIREVVDTKRFDHLELNDSLSLVVVNAYFKALPNEMGLCIYGHYRDSTIVVVGLHADSVFTSRSRIAIFCEDTIDGVPIIGDIHSHPTASNPAYPCVASPLDYYSLLVDNYGVLVVYCGNGSGVTIFRDGRWWNFAWR